MRSLHKLKEHKNRSHVIDGKVENILHKNGESPNYKPRNYASVRMAQLAYIK